MGLNLVGSTYGNLSPDALLCSLLLQYNITNIDWKRERPAAKKKILVWQSEGDSVIERCITSALKLYS